MSTRSNFSSRFWLLAALLLWGGLVLTAAALGQITATCVISGTVTDIGGTPIQNAVVRMRTISPTLVGNAGLAVNDLTTKTASDGTWSLTVAQALNAQIDIPAVGIAKDTIVPSTTTATFSSLTLYNRGTLTPATILSTAGPSMGGDLTGSSPNPRVVGFRGYSLVAGTPTHGQAYVYNNSDGAFRLTNINSSTSVGTVTSVGVSGGSTGLTVSGSPVSSSGTMTLGGTLAATSGGTGQTSYTAGDLLYASSSTALSRLGIGGNGTCLSVSAGALAWGSCGTGGGGGYATIAEEGSDLTQRTKLNFVGAALTATDNAGASRTDVTLSQSPASASVVGTGRSVSTTSPLGGGGDLSADRTLTCSTCVTSAAALVANQLVTGGGGQSSTTLGSLGTSTQVLHGNASGAPSWGAVALGTDVSGQLPVGSGGTGAATAAAGFDALAPTTTRGDLIARGASSNARLGLGTAGTYLRAGATDPAWSALTLADATAQGTTTTVLHGNAAGAVSFSAVSLSADTTGTLGETKGGTNQTAYALGDTLYASATNTLAKLAGNTTTTRKYLQQTGDGANSAAPAWGTIQAADVPTLNQSTTGNAATATALASNPTDCSSNQFANAIDAGGNLTCAGLTLAGAQFANQGTTTTVLHGNAAGNPSFGAVSLTADVSGILPGANGGTGNGFTAFSGPTTALKTFSLPDASATLLTSNAAVTVAQGGSGATSLTGLLQGNGTSPFTAVSDSSTVGQVLRVTGASTYGWGALDLADSDAVTGTLPAANYATMVGDSGSGGTKGAVPAPGVGDATKCLLGSGVWGSCSTGSLTGSGSAGKVAIWNTTSDVTYGIMSDDGTTTRFPGNVALTETYVTLGTDQDPYTPAGPTAYLGITASSSFALKGLAGGADGRRILIENRSAANTVTISHQGATTAANSIISPSGADFVLPAQNAATLTYDTTSSRWRITSSTAVDASSGQIVGVLDVPSGGSGAATLTGLLQGNGTGAFTAVTNSTTVGQVLRVTGSNTYGWGAVDLADTDAVTGTLPAANYATMVGDSGAGGTKGAVPAPAAGDAAALKFLKADGTWAAPSGGSPAGSATELQYRNAGAFGAVTGTTVDVGNNTNPLLLINHGINVGKPNIEYQAMTSQTAALVNYKNSAGAVKTRVRPDGLVDIAGGTAATPQIAAGTRTVNDWNLFSVDAQNNGWCVNRGTGTPYACLSYGVSLANNGAVYFASGADANTTTWDTSLFRNAAGRLVASDGATTGVGKIGGKDGSGSNAAGKDFSIQGGGSTGTGFGGEIIGQTTYPGASGSSLNTFADRYRAPSKWTTLTDATATDLATLTYGASAVVGADFLVTVKANDATDFQGMTYRVRVNSVRKATGNTVSTVGIVDDSGTLPAAAASTGTLTCTFSLTEGASAVVLRANCDTSLTATTFAATYQVQANGSGLAITQN